jgi:prophage maintenance system killer protein
MAVWLSRQIILAIHDEQLRTHGGAAGVRDEGLRGALCRKAEVVAGAGEGNRTLLASLEG